MVLIRLLIPTQTEREMHLLYRRFSCYFYYCVSSEICPCSSDTVQLIEMRFTMQICPPLKNSLFDRRTKQLTLQSPNQQIENSVLAVGG